MGLLKIFLIVTPLIKLEGGADGDDDDDDFIEIPHPDDSEQMALNQFVPEVSCSYFNCIY